MSYKLEKATNYQKKIITIPDPLLKKLRMIAAANGFSLNKLIILTLQNLANEKHNN
jgi:predicted HicB family RNase H-like nuclease